MMINVPPFIARAWRRIEAWREARQRQERFQRMLRADPVLRLAHERRLQHQRHHDSTAQDLREQQARLHEMLRQGVRHG